MGSFFKEVEARQALPNAAAIFDWLLDDNRFQGNSWTKNNKAKFTKQVKRLDGFSDKAFRKKTSNEAYPAACGGKRNRRMKPYALFSVGSSLGVDFVRHIRNAIAHGHINLYTSGNQTYLEAIDYSRNKAQSSYIAMPITYLESIFNIYHSITGQKR